MLVGGHSMTGEASDSRDEGLTLKPFEHPAYPHLGFTAICSNNGCPAISEADPEGSRYLTTTDE